MSEHHRDTMFLKHVILYDGSEERSKLEHSIAQIQHDVRCVKHVAWVMALVLLLILASIGYGMILQDNFPYNLPERVFTLLCEFSLALLICLAALVGLLGVYRVKLNRVREECRRLVKRLLDSHLGKPQMPGSPQGTGNREA